jgi:hypothetical protein
MTPLEQLRKMISEPTQDPWSDLMLTDIMTANSDDLRASARYVWETKAADYHALVSVSESGSSRQMQQQFEHALAMAKMYGQNPDGSSGSTAVISSQAIVRPERV